MDKESLVKILMDEMGFDEKKARRAASTNSTLEACVDWLAEHCDDADDETPIVDPMIPAADTSVGEEKAAENAALTQAETEVNIFFHTLQVCNQSAFGDPAPPVHCCPT